MSGWRDLCTSAGAPVFCGGGCSIREGSENLPGVVGWKLDEALKIHLKGFGEEWRGGEGVAMTLAPWHR